MLSRQSVNRLIIVGFMVLVGYCLAKAIYQQSTLGIVLAMISFTSGICFLYLVVRAGKRADADEVH